MSGMLPTRVLIEEASELQERLTAIAVRAAVPREANFRSAVSTIAFEDVTLEVVQAGPLFLMGAARAGRRGCIVLLEGAEGTRWNAKPLDPLETPVLQPGAPFAAAFNRPCTFALVSAERPWREPARPVAPPQAGGATRARLVSLIRTVHAEGGAPPGVEARQLLRNALLDAAGRLQDAAQPRREARRHRAVAQQRIVREADTYLCARPDKPVYTEELCGALGVSASGLQEAFHAAFGVSPHRYLKLRRMGMARAMLLSPAAPYRSVKAAALSCGFWHLGQFSRDYRLTFGELPSETLVRRAG